MGLARVGSALRFIPYPVVSGFMAGSGLFLAISAGKMALSQPLSFAALPQLFAGPALPKTIATLVLPVILFSVRRFWRPFYLLPLLFFVEIVVVHVALAASGLSLTRQPRTGASSSTSANRRLRKGCMGVHPLEINKFAVGLYGLPFSLQAPALPKDGSPARATTARRCRVDWARPQGRNPHGLAQQWCVYAAARLTRPVEAPPRHRCPPCRLRRPWHICRGPGGPRCA